MPNGEMNEDKTGQWARGASLAELEAHFGRLPVQDWDGLDGLWPGQMLAAPGIDRLPRPLRAALWKALRKPLINPWRGKGLSERRGDNHWFNCPGMTFGAFRTEEAVAEDGLPVLVLNYDIPGNPSWLRPVRGQLRNLDPDRLLGRMNYLVRGEPRRLMFFMLERGHYDSSAVGKAARMAAWLTNSRAPWSPAKRAKDRLHGQIQERRRNAEQPA